MNTAINTAINTAADAGADADEYSAEDDGEEVAVGGSSAVLRSDARRVGECACGPASTSQKLMLTLCPIVSRE